MVGRTVRAQPRPALCLMMKSLRIVKIISTIFLLITKNIFLSK